MGKGIVAVNVSVQNSLQGMILRGRSPSSYFNRVLLQEFKDAQNARFQTENASQGSKWAPLNPQYKKYKEKKYAEFPGSGRALMVRTGALSKGALAMDSSYYYKAITDRSFVIGINKGEVPYATYAGVARPYMAFSKETITEWRTNLVKYIGKGIE